MGKGFLSLHVFGNLWSRARTDGQGGPTGHHFDTHHSHSFSSRLKTAILSENCCVFPSSSSYSCVGESEYAEFSCLWQPTTNLPNLLLRLRL